MNIDTLEGCVEVGGNVVSFSGRARANTRHAIYDLHVVNGREDVPVGAVWEWPNTDGQRDYSLALTTNGGRFQGRLETIENGRDRFRIKPYPPIGIDP